MIKRGSQTNGVTEHTLNNTTKMPQEINRVLMALYLDRLAIALSCRPSTNSRRLDKEVSVGIMLDHQEIIAFNYNHPSCERNDAFPLKFI